MSDRSGHIELERSVDAVLIGARHRTDLGDLDPLMASIQRLGLLQPVTITPDGVLICGRRRLEAVKQMGWKTLRVWVRSGITDELSQLLAQQDDNATHKPLSPIEAAALYRELKTVLQEDAARRQRASRFAAETDEPAREQGAAESAAPWRRGEGDVRRRAAETVTQSASYARLEQIGEIERIAADRTRPADIRKIAEDELQRIRDGGAVDPGYQRLKAALELAKHRAPADDEADLEALAAQALARAKEERARRIRENREKRAAAAERARRSVRSFAIMWSELGGWSKHYDAAEIAAQLKEADWAMFERVLAETNDFAAAVRDARAVPAAS